MNKKELKSIEWSILICAIILTAIGLFALYSASENVDQEYLKKQVIWVIVSIPILIITTIIDYRTIAKVSFIFYIVFMLLLIAVLLTSAINGATSWFNLGRSSNSTSRICKNCSCFIFSKYNVNDDKRRDK